MKLYFWGLKNFFPEVFFGVSTKLSFFVIVVIVVIMVIASMTYNDFNAHNDHNDHNDEKIKTRRRTFAPTGLDRSLCLKAVQGRNPAFDCDTKIKKVS